MYFYFVRQGARNEIFAMQPAPIQVSYMGFPGTTGATYIDYLVTDEVGQSPLHGYSCWYSVIFTDLLSFSWQFVSPTRFAHIYSEKLVHLPHCYFVNDYKQVFDGIYMHALVVFLVHNNHLIAVIFFNHFIRKTVMS